MKIAVVGAGAIGSVVGGLLSITGEDVTLIARKLHVDAMCDRLAIMDHGHILAINTPKGLKESVGADSIVTVSSTGNLDTLAKLLQERIEGTTKSQRIDNVIQLHIKGTTGVLPKVVSIAEQGGFNITDLSVAEPTLETVFINLTGKELRD